jgi:PhnB protein
MRFGEMPDGASAEKADPALKDKIMHASLRIGDSEVFASDGHAKGKPEFKGISLSLTVPTTAEADRVFNALAAGGQIQMPIEKTFFSPRFGMVADRFGVSWMVMAERPE